MYGDKVYGESSDESESLAFSEGGEGGDKTVISMSAIISSPGFIILVEIGSGDGCDDLSITSPTMIKGRSLTVFTFSLSRPKSSEDSFTNFLRVEGEVI